MVGIIHPFSVASRELPHLPLHELVWIAWNHHRGDHEPSAICVVCANVGEWCLDLIWSKWNYKHFIKYNEFIHSLIFTNTFDKWMGTTASCNLEQMEVFFYGFRPI